MVKLKIGIAVRKRWIHFIFPFTQWDLTIDTEIDEMELTHRIRTSIDKVVSNLKY